MRADLLTRAWCSVTRKKRNKEEERGRHGGGGDGASCAAPHHIVNHSVVSVTVKTDYYETNLACNNMLQ